MSGQCYACQGTELETIFSMKQIPQSSNILLLSREEALAFGRGDMQMTICHTCGFMQNDAFDPQLVDYTMPYEESQAFSPRFVKFQNELIDRLLAEYPMEGKTIFEIGCGKASFLETICRQGGARGIGIDPTIQPGRLNSDVDLTLIPDFFDADNTHLTGDLICHRHTLEHIQPVADFVSLTRESAANTPGSVMFVEVPDTDRILAEGAFWDVFYEHCSYFTALSVDRLFRACGLTVTRLELGFDDQYLLIDAVPGDPDDAIDRAAVEALVGKARRFGTNVAAEVDRWQHRIDEVASGGRPVVLWGAGSKAVGFLSALGEGIPVEAVVDINPFKQGSFLPGPGHEIIAPDALKDLEPGLVIVMNPIYAGEIGDSIRDMGLDPALEAAGIR